MWPGNAQVIELQEEMIERARLLDEKLTPWFINRCKKSRQHWRQGEACKQHIQHLIQVVPVKLISSPGLAYRHGISQQLRTRVVKLPQQGG